MRAEGKARVEIKDDALVMLDRYDFDTNLFPIDLVLFSEANFGAQILKHAQKRGMGILAP